MALADWQFMYNGFLFGADMPVGLTGIDGLNPPAVKDDVRDKVAAHGAFVHAEFLTPRYITLQGDMLGNDVNVLANASLTKDTDNNGIPDSWSNSAATSIAPDESCVEITGDADFEGIVQEFPATQGQVWAASVDMRRLSGTRQVNVWCEALNSGHSVINSSAAWTTSSSWSRLSIAHTMPASTAYVGILIGVDTGTGTTVCRARRAQLELASAASAFAPGFEQLINEWREVFKPQTTDKTLLYKLPGISTQRINCRPIRRSYPINRDYERRLGTWAVELVAGDPAIYSEDGLTKLYDG